VRGSIAGGEIKEKKDCDTKLVKGGLGRNLLR
jgi:hypothetical protein